jgi:hypothetical protein
MTGAALTLPATADRSQTEVLRLFHRYQAIKAAANAHIPKARGKGEDAEMMRLFWRHADKIEDRMMALPSTSAAALAAKMIVAHCDGDFSCLSLDDPVWVEARALTSN